MLRKVGCSVTTVERLVPPGHSGHQIIRQVLLLEDLTQRAVYELPSFLGYRRICLSVYTVTYLTVSVNSTLSTVTWAAFSGFFRASLLPSSATLLTSVLPS